MASARGIKPWGRRRIAAFLRAFPAPGVALAGQVGRHLGTGRVLGGAPSSEEVQALFGPLSRSETARIRRAMAAHERQNQALFCLLRQRGLEAAVPLVRVRDEARLRRLGERSEAGLLVTWHVGAPVAPLAGFLKLGVPVISLGHNSPFPPGYETPDPVRYVIGEGRRMAFLKQALDRLRAGGLVFLAPDGEVGSAFAELPFLGRSVALGRGVATLARRSGAPILPATTRWRGGRVELQIHEPLAVPDAGSGGKDAQERAVLAAIAGWFEDYVRSHPGDLRVRWLRRYLAAPPAAAAGGAPA